MKVPSVGFTMTMSYKWQFYILYGGKFQGFGETCDVKYNKTAINETLTPVFVINDVGNDVINDVGNDVSSVFENLQLFNLHIIFIFARRDLNVFLFILKGVSS